MPNSPSPVVVNLNVNVDATHGVTVFEDSPETISDLIVCKTTLDVANLYVGDAENEALFEFQGQDDEIAGRASVVIPLDETTDARFGNSTRATAFAEGLASILTTDSNDADALDAAEAQPFNDEGKAYTSTFQEYTSFGRIALSAYAHHLFGHVQATAAITNDVAIVEHMNSEGVGKANICSSLVTAIYTMDPEAATAVVKQVIGQDASRTREVDNDLTSPDSWQRLKWIDGDKIYVQVTLLRPSTITVADNTFDVQQYVPSANSLPELGIKYSFEITLSAPAPPEVPE